MWGNITIAFMLAFITSFVITPYTMRLAHRVGAMDLPEERKIHKKPIPRLGGLAIITGFLLSVLYLLFILNMEKTIDLGGTEKYGIKLMGFLFGIIILGITCFIDDSKNIPAGVKLLAQLVVAIIVTACGIKIDMIEIPFLEKNLILNNVFSYILTIGWIVGITNAINLIDGLDGLSSGISLISCISLLIIFATNGSSILSIILITALAGGIVGFLPFNFNPAKTFVGDVGSNFLGFSLAVISILGVAKTYTVIVLIAPLIVLGLPIFDTIFAIFRRIIKGKSLKAVFKPDKGHLHHRLMAKGYTQKQAVLILYGLSATLGMFAIILLDSGLWKAVSFALLVVAIFAVGYKDIFKKESLKRMANHDKKEKHTKKILFAAVSMDVGGIETALVTLLNYLAKQKKYEITLVLENKLGIFLDYIDSNIKIIEYTPNNNKIIPIRKIINLFKQIKFKNKYKNRYDFSASYATYSNSGSFVARTASKNSALWCHMDYLTQFNNDEEQVRKFFKQKHYNKFNKIIFVSERSKQTFLKVFPELKKTVLHINNFIDGKGIESKSNEKLEENIQELKERDNVIFLNVGRHDERQKRLTRLLEATKMLKLDTKVKKSFKLILIGDGEDTNQYKKIVKKYGIEDVVCFMGRKKNPYPYFKLANYVILTSDYEGSPVVFTEAMILNVPIITTDVAGAEQLRGNYGIITTREVNDIYKTMKKAINNQFKIKEKFDYEEYNAKIKQQLIKLIEEGKR